VLLLDRGERSKKGRKKQKSLAKQAFKRRTFHERPHKRGRRAEKEMQR